MRSAAPAVGQRVEAAAQPIERGRRRVERVPGEVELAAVVRGKAQVAIGERIVAAIGERLQAQELAGGLGHLGVVGEQEVAVHPEVREPRADARLGLRDLVGMVDRNVVLAAAVDVEEVAQVLLRHRRALDVPAGKADAPGARPTPSAASRPAARISTARSRCACLFSPMSTRLPASSPALSRRAR